MADWRDRAACRGLDTNMFFPERGDHQTVEAAKAVCAGCPVAAECLDEALRLPGELVQLGIWGGTSGRQRRQIIQGQRRPSTKVAACGTNAGYTRHRREGEPPCEACRQAHARYVQGAKAARRGAAA